MRQCTQKRCDATFNPSKKKFERRMNELNCSALEVCSRRFTFKSDFFTYFNGQLLTWLRLCHLSISHVLIILKFWGACLRAYGLKWQQSSCTRVLTAFAPGFRNTLETIFSLSSWLSLLINSCPVITFPFPLRQSTTNNQPPVRFGSVDRILSFVLQDALRSSP